MYKTESFVVHCTQDIDITLWADHGPSWGRPSGPGLRTLTLGKNRWPKLRTLEPLATPTAAPELLCISLASLLSIEEHPSVSATDPPQLPQISLPCSHEQRSAAISPNLLHSSVYHDGQKYSGQRSRSY